MSAIVKCESCGRVAFARIIEDDYSTNAFECEPDWQDEDYEWETVSIDGTVYFFQADDVDCKLYLEPCQHEEYEVTDVEYDYEPPDPY